MLTVLKTLIRQAGIGMLEIIEIIARLTILPVSGPKQ